VGKGAFGKLKVKTVWGGKAKTSRFKEAVDLKRRQIHQKAKKAIA